MHSLRMHRAWNFSLVLLFIGFNLIACDGPRGVVTALNTETPAAPVNSPGTYRLSPGDKLKVTVFNEVDLTGEFQVNERGNIAFPLVGEVQAANSTSDEFQQRLTARLRGKYVKKPRVSVEMISYRPVNVLGEVRNAGQIQYRPGLTLQDAVALAGGFTYRANTRTVYVRRADASGEVSISTDGERVPILPGDNIRVPERYF
ncbi:MAG: polysaccharide export protein [Xanthobacteraceae bacterium]|nr:polysaccharide export protein [Xanthobacteraceae bacterium]